MKTKNILFIILICILLAGTVIFAIKIYDNEMKTFNFEINDTLPSGEGKTVRVVLLGGQSNASGCSRDDYLQKYVSEEKYEEYKNGYDHVYINYLSGAKTSNGYYKTPV